MKEDSILFWVLMVVGIAGGDGAGPLPAKGKMTHAKTLRRQGGKDLTEARSYPEFPEGLTRLFEWG